MLDMKKYRTLKLHESFSLELRDECMELGLNRDSNKWIAVSRSGKTADFQNYVFRRPVKKLRVG